MSVEERLNNLNEEDRKVVESGIAGASGHVYKKLYSGEQVFMKKERNICSLLLRTAVYAEDNKEQMARIFKSSGLYEETMTDELIAVSIKEAIKTKNKILKDLNLLIEMARDKQS